MFRNLKNVSQFEDFINNNNTDEPENERAEKVSSSNERLDMGETAKPFSALVAVICRTAKRSANKMSRIRRRKAELVGETVQKSTSATTSAPTTTKWNSNVSEKSTENGELLSNSPAHYWQHKFFILSS